MKHLIILLALSSLLLVTLDPRCRGDIFVVPPEQAKALAGKLCGPTCCVPSGGGKCNCPLMPSGSCTLTFLACFAWKCAIEGASDYVLLANSLQLDDACQDLQTPGYDCNTTTTRLAMMPGAAASKCCKFERHVCQTVGDWPFAHCISKDTGARPTFGNVERCDALSDLCPWIP